MTYFGGKPKQVRRPNPNAVRQPVQTAQKPAAQPVKKTNVES